jgi:hypothetical protein
MEDNPWIQSSPAKLPEETMDKCRDIIFNLLALGFTNLDPKYGVLKRD